MKLPWRILLSALMLCAHAAITTASVDTRSDVTTTRRLRSNQGGVLRQLQQQEALVQNIQLRIERADQLLDLGEQRLFEEIIQEWFLRFYESDLMTAFRLGSVAGTSVTFRTQTVDGTASIITYDQVISYTPRSDMTPPELFIIRPFGALDANAILSTEFSNLPSWTGRPASFLAVPIILGALPTNAPSTRAPTTLAPSTRAPTTSAPSTSAPITAAPTSLAPTTLSPTTASPTSLPTNSPTAAPTSAPVIGVTNAPTVTQTTLRPTQFVAPVNLPSSMPVVSLPTGVSILLENLELEYKNVDSINEAQLKVVEDTTQGWFNDFYASTSNQMTATNVTGTFNFQTKEYFERSLTVLFEVMLNYQGKREDALEILQQPWKEPSSVDSLRQDLMAALPVFFDDVEATTQPVFRQASVSPAPTPDEGLSTGAIIGIIVIVVSVVLLIGVVAKFQLSARKRSDHSIMKGPTTPYSPHVNEEEGSVLFPDTNAQNAGQPPSSLGGVSMPSERDDQSYEGRSVDTNDFDYSKVGANVVAPGSRFSSTTPSVASGFSNAYTADQSDLLTQDNEDQFVIYAPAGLLGLVVDNRDDGPPVIHSIKEDSVLIDQIQMGDRLIGVDEVDVRALSPVRVSKLISKRSTEPLRKLTLTREKAGDESTAGGQSSFVGSMSRMSAVDTDTQQEDALGQGFTSSDEETSFVGSMSRVSGDGQSLDSSAAEMK